MQREVAGRSRHPNPLQEYKKEESINKKHTSSSVKTHES